MHLDETIGSLYAQVSHFKEQLLSAQRQAAEAENRCRELEARLDTAGARLHDEDRQTAAPQVTDGPVEGTAQAAPQPERPRDAAPEGTIGEPGRDSGRQLKRARLWAASGAFACRRQRGDSFAKPPRAGVGPGGSGHRDNDVWPGWFLAYVGMEEAAQSIRVYESNFIPGLLQTEEYATAVVSLGELPAEQAERLVMLRKERQRRFREGRLRLWVLLDEAALRCPVAGIEVHLQQLRYLQEACTSPTLTMQILPPLAGGHAVPTGFAILRFAERDLPDIVYLEQLTSAVYLDRQADVDRYLLAAERLSSMACEPQEPRR